MSSTFVWTMGDVVNFIVFMVVILIAGGLSIAQWFREQSCKHDEGVSETQACDAICRKCGKNLGFIGTWRKNHEQ